MEKNAFWEPSSRTADSLSEGAERLGFRCGRQITPENSSIKKNEPFTRAVFTALEQRTGVLCLRTTIEGVGLHLAHYFERAADRIPYWVHEAVFVNGGDGRKNHPTQILLDVVCYTAYRLGMTTYNNAGIKALEVKLAEMSDDAIGEFITATLNGLKIAIVGDGKNSRVTNSWIDLGRLFDIKFLFVAPQPFQVDQWRLEGVKYSVSDKLSDAKGCHIVYTIRTQIERLDRIMSVAEAEEAIASVMITPEFLRGFNGVIMDAQPLDAERPIIHPSLWSDPQVIMDFQAGCGSITRCAVFDECWSHRHDHIELPSIAQVEPSRILAAESIAAHIERVKDKWAGDQRSVNPIYNGTVLDRLKAGSGSLLDLLLERAGVYGREGSDSIIANRKRSTTLTKKDILFLEDRFVPYQMLAALTMLAREMVVVEMRDGQYRKMSFDLPPAIAQIFNCPNTNCITRNDPEAETFFRVNAGEVPSFDCVYCRDRFSASQMRKSLALTH
ncbi:MAG: aspartate carbamoyltransferase regulatory subunit [Patescibacteria group bacterium]|nr:aspartate carbamoyltransferase regulatory subunit [Patescibacteria group bacterium]